jgi:hypothetical protein
LADGWNAETLVMTAAEFGLLDGLFDDAGLFPPAASTVAQAVAAHARHRVSWYDDLIATFSSNDSRLIKVNACAARLGLPTVEVTVVVPTVLDSVPDALATLRRCPRLTLRAVDAPMGTTPTAVAARMADALAEDGIPLYVEVPGSLSTEARLHLLRTHGMRLKLRAGGTSFQTFTPERRLALLIVTCAAERLPFKCVTGMSCAFRHRDPESLFQRHGFLNIALATLVAVRTGSEAAVRAILAERDRRSVAAEVLELTPRDVAAVRALLTRVGSSDLTESVADLTSFGILAEN